MVFQDFDLISERRKAEKQRKFRKRVTIAAITAFVLVVLIAAGIFAVVTLKKEDNSNSSKGNKSNVREVSRSQKLIQTICNGTTYKRSCNETLSSAAKKNPSLNEPQQFLKVSISAILDEVTKAMNDASKFNLDTPEVQGAFNVCKKYIGDAKRELQQSISCVEGHNLLRDLSKNAGDLNSWLSAVISYQQTCIDAFPEGDLKSDMDKVLKATRQLASNALAIIQQFSTYLSKMKHKKDKEGSSRRLLESKPPLLDQDGFPTWMNHEDRRMLQQQEPAEPDVRLTPNATVAKDGSGQFNTIQAALDAMPKNHDGRYVIYVKEGIYDEFVIVRMDMLNVTLYGDGSQKSIITGRKNSAEGFQTVDTASFAAEGEGFLAKSMGFRNTAGPEKHQAVAARVLSDRAIFLNCRFEGFQDTLLVQAHRQFYRSCLITGTIDFIFGDAAAIFQNCKIIVRKGLQGQQNVVTAQGRTEYTETTAIVLQSCRIEPEDALEQAKNDIKSYLGRPWKPYSRTAIIESTIGDFIHPEGWLPFRGNNGLDTLYYAEYDNKGNGAKTDARVKWPGYKVIDRQQAAKFTLGTLYSGEWIKRANAPVHFGLMH